MGHIKGSFIITPKDIQTIEGKSLSTARRELVALQDTLEKEKISIKEYCQYWKLDLEDIIEHLNQYR